MSWEDLGAILGAVADLFDDESPSTSSYERRRREERRLREERYRLRRERLLSEKARLERELGLHKRCASDYDVRRFCRALEDASLWHDRLDMIKDFVADVNVSSTQAKKILDRVGMWDRDKCVRVLRGALSDPHNRYRLNGW